MLKAQTGNSDKDPYDKPFYHKFASILSLLIRKKTLTLGSMVVLFILSLVIMGLMPQNFSPEGVRAASRLSRGGDGDSLPTDDARAAGEAVAAWRR